MSQWFEKWFNEDYLLLYQNRNDEDAKKQFSLVEQNQFLQKDSKILELGCGAGRYLNLFYQRGYQNIFGIDLSETLLEKAILLNKHLSVQKCDMRYFSGNYDTIFSFFTSFGYFDDGENFQLLQRIYNHLEKGGYFWLDYLNSKFLEKNLKTQTEREVNQRKITEKRKIHNGRVEKEITIDYQGNQREFKESVAFYSKENLENFFQKIGFQCLKIFGNYKGEDFNDNSPRLIFLVSK